MGSSRRTTAARTFVHYSSIDGDGYRSLDDGARVSYESEEGPKGPVAYPTSPS